jgi:hypothetical protein
VEYKGIKYSILEIANGWKWVVHLGATRIRTGFSRTRAHAVLDAERAIDKALEGMDRAT